MEFPSPTNAIILFEGSNVARNNDTHKDSLRVLAKSIPKDNIIEPKPNILDIKKMILNLIIFVGNHNKVP